MNEDLTFLFNLVCFAQQKGHHGFVLSGSEILMGDIVCFSGSLFGTLQAQFEHIFSAEGKGFDPKEFLLLLRCGIIALQAFEFDLSLVEEKCQILIHLLRMSRPPCLRSDSHLPADAAQPDIDAAAPASLSRAILEVFMHELLVHQKLRKYIALTDYVSSTTEKLFLSCHSHGDINAILELVASHFLLSLHNEWASSRFFHSLSWSIEDDDNVILEIGLNAALELLSTPVVFSAPHFLQAHLILFTSSCNTIHMPTEGGKSDVVMNHYIKAFEHSLKLYVHYMSTLDLVDNIIGLEDQSNFHTEALSFSSCIQPLTCDEINHQIDRLVKLSCTQSCDVLSGTEADIINNLATYIVEKNNLMDDRSEICLVLKYIISNVLSGQTESNIVHSEGEIIKQEMYCLAAVLKLMGSSLLHILRHWKHNMSQSGSENDYIFCKEYDFVPAIIGCFQKYRTNQPIQDVLFDVKGKHHGLEETKLMLSHFASLLLCIFRRRLGMLWKGCIFMMIATVNLLVFEEGNLNAFGSLLGDVIKNSSHQNYVPKTSKDSVNRRSSVLIESNLQKIRKRYLEDQIKFNPYEDQWKNIRGGSSSSSFQIEPPPSSLTRSENGEAFFSCLWEYQENPSEFDDLLDFVECTPGKDYPSWLKSRKKFTAWKQKKRAAARHRRRQQRRKNMAVAMKRVKRTHG